jgi:hypothetical protein
MSEILKRFTLLPRIEIPLLGVSLPAVELPEFPPRVPKLDDRRLEALRYAVMDDLGGLVPVVGDVLSDVAYAELRKRMSPEEFEKFLEANKALPSSLAAIKVFHDLER